MSNTDPQHTAIDAQDPQPTSTSARCTAATLYLMSHYAQRPCPLVAHAIADHLGQLSRNCLSGTSGLMQSLAAALLPRWQHIARGSAGAARH